MEEKPDTSNITIRGARQHNLKSIDLDLPRDKFIVITGLSGSGKSSLAFDTIYAEGQRRYLETMMAYARQFLEILERPDVDLIEGLSPSVAIEQKTISTNPHSTVGTVTEIYDYVRLLFAKVGTQFCVNCNIPVQQQTHEQILQTILSDLNNKNILLLAPLVIGRKGHYRELFKELMAEGFVQVRVDGSLRDLNEGMEVSRYSTHTIELVVDKLKIQKKVSPRLRDSLKLSLERGAGTVIIHDYDLKKDIFFSRLRSCPKCGTSYPDLAPNSFSFNSKFGMCRNCNGIGLSRNITPDAIVTAPGLSITEGALLFPRRDDFFLMSILNRMLEPHGVNAGTPFKEFDSTIRDLLFFGKNQKGSQKRIKFAGVSISNLGTKFEGLVPMLRNLDFEAYFGDMYKDIEAHLPFTTCEICDGTRLKPESRFVRVIDGDGRSTTIDDVVSGSIDKVENIFKNLTLPKRNQKIAQPILHEIKTRLAFLLNVGLNYLNLNRPSGTLSGGESQRIRLATQIGSQLTGVLYVIDEPSIGLHQRDNERLINSLKSLRDIGNTIIVVEHDRETMENADYIVDLGPGAGEHGGYVVKAGTLKELLSERKASLTAAYLRNEKEIPIRPDKNLRKPSGKSLVIEKASGNNLKEIKVKFPLGLFICITGVSGSGKSSLINDTLYRILGKHFYRLAEQPLPYKSISGIEFIDKVVNVDQSPIGRTPRSNPATYVGVFTAIRDLYAQLPESKIRGYKPGRFSFNVKDGRCPSCEGDGMRKIEMSFLPDVYVKCEVCNGKRFSAATLDVKYKGKSISDVLEMTVEDALQLFTEIPAIKRKLQTMNEVGLGYIRLGQSSTTLSGGEAQRVKLSTELSKVSTGRTLYILDEPTTGLHFEDIRILLDLLQKLVDRGNTAIVVEHNLDVVKCADWIIDLGPEGGEAGGRIVAEGPPREIMKNRNSHTARYLEEYLKNGTDGSAGRNTRRA
ncbi:MAG TPA: excinuclease ABC subunit UvrA [Candidatus Acidoferrales bacterium]|nr:excinuclease ABC subunit UvrA [Candidatus Acidoferrales bacterium]